jgi:hypothetical protein
MWTCFQKSSQSFSRSIGWVTARTVRNDIVFRVIFIRYVFGASNHSSFINSRYFLVMTYMA